MLSELFTTVRGTVLLWYLSTQCFQHKLYSWPYTLTLCRACFNSSLLVVMAICTSKSRVSDLWPVVTTMIILLIACWYRFQWRERLSHHSWLILLTREKATPLHCYSTTDPFHGMSTPFENTPNTWFDPGNHGDQLSGETFVQNECTSLAHDRQHPGLHRNRLPVKCGQKLKINTKYQQRTLTECLLHLSMQVFT